jgi:hypothetical protein
MDFMENPIEKMDFILKTPDSIPKKALPTLGTGLLRWRTISMPIP